MNASLPKPDSLNQVWSLDFLSDALSDGRRFRILGVMDQCSRECLTLAADTSIGGARVARELDALVARYGRPLCIVSDNGFTESLNGRIRDECLNEHVFESLAAARRLIETWRQDYNNDRPHGSLNNQTLAAYRAGLRSTLAVAQPVACSWTGT